MNFAIEIVTGDGCSLADRPCDTHLLRDGVVAEYGLVAVPLLLELHVAEEHDARDDLPDGVEVVVRHPHDAQRLHRRRELLGVVDAPHRHVVLRQERVALRRLDDVLLCNGKRDRVTIWRNEHLSAERFQAEGGEKAARSAS